MNAKNILRHVIACLLVLFVCTAGMVQAAEGQDPAIKYKATKPTVRPVQPTGPLTPVRPVKSKEVKPPSIKLFQRLEVPYRVRDDAVAPDLGTFFVVGRHFVARWDRGKRQETARLTLEPYSQQKDTQVRIALHPQGGKLYVALDQVNQVTPENPAVAQYQLLLLEVDAQTLRVLRDLPFGTFDTPQGAQVEKVYDLILSQNGRAAYIFGLYPKIGDRGTVGSIAWADLAKWQVGDIQYIQDIVERSGVRACRDANRWPFRHPHPVLVPGTNRIFIMTDHNNPQVLEGTVHPRTGLTPVSTIASLEGCRLLGVMADRLYYEERTNVRSLPLSNLEGEGIFYFPDADGAVVPVPKEKNLLASTKQGLVVYHAPTKARSVYGEFSRDQLKGKRIEALHVGRPQQRLLIRASKGDNTSYILFGY